MDKKHELKETGGIFYCTACCWQWKSKPKSSCPGVPRYEFKSYPDGVGTEVDLRRMNLKLRPDAKPCGCVYFRRDTYYELLYNQKDCEVADPALPPVILWDDRGNLKTAGELRDMELVPPLTLKPLGVASVWDRQRNEIVWVPLYNPDDCQPGAGEGTYITKSTLKQHYQFSEGWIKKLGEPDRLEPNPHRSRNPKYAIRLYHRLRVQRFLEDNAEDYAAWLERRQKFLKIFEANRDKILQGLAAERNQRLAIRQQTSRCLRCASGCSTPMGFLCAIYPLGLDVDQIPCPDWVERKWN